MAWLFVPGLEDSNSDSESSGPDFAPSVTLSGKATQRPLSWRGWASRPWIKLLSGVRFPISTVNRGAAEWIASLEESPASRSAWQESVMASPIRGGSVQTSSGWSMKYEIQPGGSSSSWRTSQGSLWPEDSTISSEAWRTLSQGGGVRNGCAYPRQPWEPRTKGLASSGSSWQTNQYPTPSATPYGSSQNEGKVPHKRPSAGTPSLDNWARNIWPTPRAITGGAESAERKQELGRTESGGGDLQAAAKQWPTPRAQDSYERSNWKTVERAHRGEAQMTLTRFVRGKATEQKWPTPTANDAFGSGSRNAEGSKAHAGVSLSDKVLTGDSRGRQGRVTQTDGESGSLTAGRRQRLNPNFVEALMGLPAGFSTPTIGCGASAIRSYLSRQRRLLANLLGG